MKHKLCKICGSKLTRGNLYCSNYCRANDPEMKRLVSIQMTGRKILWNDKISDALKGRKQTEEQIRKIHENNPGMRGHKHSSSTIRKMRIGKLGIKNPMFGRTLSVLTKRKMRLSMIRYIKSTRGTLKTNVGKNETKLLNEQEKKDGVRIIRQWDTRIGYIVDGYCPETNTIYEVYERYHNQQVRRDLEREMEIRNHLFCNFVIIEDNR